MILSLKSFILHRVNTSGLLVVQGSFTLDVYFHTRVELVLLSFHHSLILVLDEGRAVRALLRPGVGIDAGLTAREGRGGGVGDTSGIE